MRETLCFCLILSFLWEQMVKAYKFMSGICLVIHPSKQQVSDCSGQPTKMDVSALEEQYNCLKQKQKLQTHIIVFKAGGNETVPRESIVNTVLINKKTRTAKSLQEGLPVREVSLDLPCNGNIQDNSPWRIHLGIHRLAQGEPQKSPYDSQLRNEQTNSRLLSQEESMLPCDELSEESEESNELHSKQEKIITAEKTNSSNLAFTSVSSLGWTQSQMSASKLTPTSCKIPYYPFPQKKTPKISEAARRLGLYVSQ